MGYVNYRRVTLRMLLFVIGVTLFLFGLSVRSYAVFPSSAYAAEIVDNDVAPVVVTGVAPVYTPQESPSGDTFVNLQYLDMGDLWDNGVFTVKAPTDLSDQYCVRVTNIDSGLVQSYKFPSVDKPSLSITTGTGNYRVEFLVRITGNSFYRGEQVEFYYDENCVGLKPYVTETLMVPMSDEIKDVATSVVQYGKTTLSKVRLIEWYIAESMYYDYIKAYTVQAGYKSDPSVILKDGCGICLDYATLMTAMLRSVDIPARMVWGYLNGVYHAWVEVASDGSWFRFDPTFADTKSGYRMNFDSKMQYIPTKYF